MDEQGRKQSKSLGNVVSPQKVWDSLGADILRLWVASTDFRSEMVASDEILKRTSDQYRRIRNTFRFILGNLSDFNNKNKVGSKNNPILRNGDIIHIEKNFINIRKNQVIRKAILQEIENTNELKKGPNGRATVSADVEFTITV